MDTSNLVEYLVMVANHNLLLNLGMHLLVLISIVSMYLVKNMKLRKYIVEGTVMVLFLSVTTKCSDLWQSVPCDYLWHNDSNGGMGAGKR